ncbi:MAG: hypothetical protein ACE5LU_06955, partial [Anaerolineae bacterium]
MLRETKVSPTLIDEWIRWTGLPWTRAIVAVGLVLILLLLGAAYLDGVLIRPFDGYSWWDELDGPAIIVYILLVYRLLERFGLGAIEAFRPLVALDTDDFDRLLAGASVLDRRREWLAFGVGAAAGLLITRPWNLPGLFFWMTLYALLSRTLTFGLLGWVIYISLADSRRFAELHRQPLNIDIFDPTPLEPIARLSLGVSLAFIGGITLSVFLNPDPQELLSVPGLILYGTSILVAFLVFFLNMMSSHRVMAEAKEQELKLVRRNLAAMYNELKERAAKDQLQDMEALSDSITAWLSYQKVIEDAPEWP